MKGAKGELHVDATSSDVLISMLPKEQLIKLAEKLNQYLAEEYDIQKPIKVPIDVFSQTLSPLEALVKFLKDHHDLTYHRIGELLERDERGIWNSYRNANQKQKKLDAKAEMKIPLTIFSKQKSILEALVMHLRDKHNMKGKEIARLLNKSTSTVWTVYNRGKRKS